MPFGGGFREHSSRYFARHLAYLGFVVVLASPWDVYPQATENTGVMSLVLKLQDALAQGDPALYAALLAEEADQAAASAFAELEFSPGDSRVVVQERNRLTIADEAGFSMRLIVEILQERGRVGRISTWRLDVRPPNPSSQDPAAPWRIVNQEVLTSLDGLYRLSLDPTKQFAASNLVLSSEDLTLTLASGSVFVAEATGGPTAFVLRGRGRMVFSPKPPAERGQLRIFSGREVFEDEFDEAFIRLPPGDLDQRITMAALTPQAVSPRDLGRAEALFGQHVDLSYALDLADLSPHLWSLLPTSGDFLADVHTRRHGTLTFARSGNEPEDITLFDRKLRRNIALYASEAKLEGRGRSYNEDDLADFDVTDYLVNASYDPERLWIDGRTRLKLKVKSHALATLTLKLAEPLTVRSVMSDRFGRLTHLRVRGQDSILISLPEVISSEETLLLSVTYSGRLPSQPLDREAMTRDVQRPQLYRPDEDLAQPEPRYIYSSRSHWYPQGPSSNYATATIQLTVPQNYSVIASGEPDPGSPVELEAGRLQFLFTARRPIRYLAFVVSRFRRVQATAITLPPPQILESGVAGNGVTIPPNPSVVPGRVMLLIEANPQQENRARNLVEKLDDLMGFYSALTGEVPYPSFTLAVSESQLPGGHSPAYFAILNQPMPTTPYVWSNDPASFGGYTDFYVAHEVAHQWWGQAVGWENYHEQWLSEGLSQYFAALYAEHSGQPGLFADILKHMRRWALDRADQGPISLGYRLGHLQSDSRVFRALVYNKGAMILHMLRRLVGDETFFRGIRLFYTNSAFRKVGTDDLQRAFEEVAGRGLDRFFRRWIFDAEVPTIRFSSRVVSGSTASTQDGGGPIADEVLVRFEQQVAEPFELPVTVRLTYVDGRVEDVIVTLADLVVEKRLPLSGALQSVDVNGDSGAVAEFVR